jgi:hypothetical protein
LHMVSPASCNSQPGELRILAGSESLVNHNSVSPIVGCEFV